MSKNAKFLLSKSIFYVKNDSNLSDFFFHLFFIKGAKKSSYGYEFIIIRLRVFPKPVKILFYVRGRP